MRLEWNQNRCISGLPSGTFFLRMKWTQIPLKLTSSAFNRYDHDEFGWMMWLAVSITLNCLQVKCCLSQQNTRKPKKRHFFSSNQWIVFDIISHLLLWNRFKSSPVLNSSFDSVWFSDLNSVDCSSSFRMSFNWHFFCRFSMKIFLFDFDLEIPLINNSYWAINRRHSIK